MAVPGRVIMNTETLSYFLMINCWGPGQCVAVIGVLVNVVNVVVFLKQGLRDSVNISLLGLTISDLGSLIILVLLNLCWAPAVTKLHLPFYPHQMMYFLFYGHTAFSRVTTGLTAWIAFERCLCIVAPLKIKTLITPGKSVMVICVLYVITIASVTPIFYTSKFVWITDPIRNTTVLSYVKIAEGRIIDDIIYIINNVLPLLFFILIVSCTAILVTTLHRNAKWRQQMTASKTQVVSKRDTKVTQMVLAISVVFIVCYIPGALFFLLPLTNQEMKVAGSERNFVIAIVSIMLLLEGIQESANFFIYIEMSSKFRATFQQLFSLRFKQSDDSKIGNVDKTVQPEGGV
ncbi:unnamed protein product [Candidula unifasciata]|uniref:G-protein coupled receptors family 1 profile domain-containing protein n=1 Tax=Candidula unifasciata TaxID=100452 RepID=A0A8S3ZYY5_9EUPU|nr:unnamed protein product [Candidula unifasciata]